MTSIYLTHEAKIKIKESNKLNFFLWDVLILYGTLSDGMLSDGMFSDGMFSDGMFSDGSFNDGTLCTLLEKFWRISLYVTDDAIAKLYVTYSLVK